MELSNTAYKKIFKVLQHIEEYITLTERIDAEWEYGDEVVVNPDIPVYRKLEKDGIISNFKYSKIPDEHGLTHPFITFDINKKELEGAITKYRSLLNGQETNYKPSSIEHKGDEVYRIRYVEQGCKIYLNDLLIAKPNYNSENEQVFIYLYNHPNRRVSTKEIEAECLKTKGHKPLKGIVQNLGFSGDMRRLFFNVSSQGIYFRNPIYRKDLDELGIKELKFGNK